MIASRLANGIDVGGLRSAVDAIAIIRASSKRFLQLVEVLDRPLSVEFNASDFTADPPRFSKDGGRLLRSFIAIAYKNDCTAKIGS